MGDATAMTQMNVRIPVQVKERGSSALESIGLSPSQAIRALWEKAARRGEDLDEVRQLLNATDEATPSADDEVLERGHALWSRFMAQAGVATKDHPPVTTTYKSLLMDALDDDCRGGEGDADA